MSAKCMQDNSDQDGLNSRHNHRTNQNTVDKDDIRVSGCAVSLFSFISTGECMSY